MIDACLKAGYAHFDCAKIYANEEMIGEAFQECFKAGKKRENLFVTTKLWHSDYGDVEGACRESLKKLQLDYVDLYLIHWPAGYFSEPQKPLHILWAEMESLVEKGLTKSIGVSNYSV